MRANGLPSWLPAGDGVPGERTHPPRFGPLTWVLPGGAAAVSAAIPAPGLRRRGALRRSGPPCESESYAKHLGRVKPATFRDVRRGTERASGAVTMPDVTHTSSSRRLLRFAIASFALALPALGQEPTPTPTASPTSTPTPTPTPTPAPTPRSLSAGSEIWTFAGVPSTGVAIGNFDGANLVKDSAGSIWGVAASDDSISRWSADRTTLSRWVMTQFSAPSSLFPDTDGTFWITELGGFRIAHFDPATGNCTEYTDASRRPTSLVR